jgi:hypothetical protein
MTVCIAAIGARDPKNVHIRPIIAMTDRKASSVEFSNEDAAVKGLLISPGWLAMFAGADISPVVPICRSVKRAYQSEIEKLGEVAGNTLEVITSAFEFCYQEYLSNLAAAKVLGRWKLTMEKFLETGRKRLGPDVFDSLCNQIEQVKLQCQFLVCGFDGTGDAHVFSIRNPGIAENHDTPGYFAIGNGAYAAMSILGFFKQSIVKDTAETFYNVTAAKLMAETASEVGKQPFFWHMTPEGHKEVHWEIYDLIVQAWREEGGQPSIPTGTVEKIRTELAAREAPPSTS